jgi:hypothetical protein
LVGEGLFYAFRVTYVSVSAPLPLLLASPIPAAIFYEKNGCHGT